MSLSQIDMASPESANFKGENEENITKCSFHEIFWVAIFEFSMFSGSQICQRCSPILRPGAPRTYSGHLSVDRGDLRARSDLG